METEFQNINTQQTILDHGMSVCDEFKKLFTMLNSNFSINIDNCKTIPFWFFQYKNILHELCSKHFDYICSYLIYHDCGKPFCLIIDDNGKRHFPNHAIISKNTFLQYSSNQFIANLIEKDMLCHITKPKDYLSLVYEPYIELLLCSALAELHSNASMFGGFASDSFKIKFKNLDKLGQRILDTKYNKNNSQGI